MKKIIRNLLHFTSSLIPIWLLKRWIKRDLISIFYHAVSDEPMDHVRHLYPIVKTAIFRDTLEALQKNFTFVTYDQLQDHILDDTPLPPNSVHLSFDDGFVECYSVVRPILLKMGIPCTFFLPLDWLDNHMLYFRHAISMVVSTMERLEPGGTEEVIHLINHWWGLSLRDSEGFKNWITAFREPQDELLTRVAVLLKMDLDNFLENSQPYLTRAQVRQMHEEGFTIGAHGLTHRKLGFILKSEVENEIVKSCQMVKEITGQEIVPFSFPQSAGNVDRRQLAEILDHHPEIGILFDTKDLRKDVKFLVNRIWAERPLTTERRLHSLQEILSHAYRDAWVDETLKRIGR